MLNVRTILGLVLGLLALTARATPAPDDNLAPRTAACTACHGPQGKAGPDGYYPRLAGKPAGYLLRQLHNFRDGKRQYAPMTHLIDTLDDANLRDMAQYFSSLSVPYPPPKRLDMTAQDEARAQALITRGDAKRGISACQDCHGRALTGVKPNVPGLLGLPADYINAQLGGWQSGQRKAHAPDCMAKIAQQLSPGDTSAVARWLASQAVPLPSGPVDRPAKSPSGAYENQCTDAAVKPAAPDPRRSALVERGEYLARVGSCAQCHTARGGAPYAGGRGIETPFGTVMTSNLTPDAQHGLGGWSAQDFWQALHHGISRDGRALYPAFPYTSYTQVTRSDSDALFAYLQSLPAAATPNQPHTLRWPYSTQWALKAWRLMFFTPAPEAAAAPPDTAADWQRGAYLVRGLGHCDECHAPRNFMGAMTQDDNNTGYVLPATQWHAPPLNSVRRQPNGVAWKQADWQRFLQTGMAPAGFASGPMAEVVLHGTQYLNDADAGAMARYLEVRARDAAAVAKPVVAATGGSSAAATAVNKKGQQVYDNHCADCHGKQGQGQSGAYPALAGNPSVLRANTNNLVLTVLQGGYPAATAGNPRPHGMPPFVLRLDDAEIAAVLTTIRSSWGNQAGAVSEFDINKLRRAQAH